MSTHEKEEVLRHLAPNLFQDVIDFHRKFSIQYDGPPRNLAEVDPDLAEFRESRLYDEFLEIKDAIIGDDMEAYLDGLVDLIYIALGTAHLCGWDFNEAWRRVHAKNMAKMRAESAEASQYKHNCDIVKPPGWTPPDLSDLV
jgi:predicted HAD superfamily Cof-like phosphohydrolase